MKQGILIVGAGKIGSIRAKVARKFSKKSKIFIFDKDFKKAKILASEIRGIYVKSLSSALKNNEINIVVVAVTNKYSKDICIAALKNGKNVLCEKPMGRNYKEALAITSAVKKYKKKFKCGFNHRYHPGIKEAYRKYISGEIGKLLFIRGAYGHGGRRGYEKEWRANKLLSGGGELLDQGSHLIDLSLWFLGFEELKKIYGTTKTMFWKMDVDDNAFATFETKSGKVAQIHASWTQWKNLFRLEIYGTKGAIEISGLGKSYGTETLRIHKREKLGKVPKIFEKKFTGPDMSWENEWRDFIRSIKLKTNVMSNENESLKVMGLISKLYKRR